MCISFVAFPLQPATTDSPSSSHTHTHTHTTCAINSLSHARPEKNKTKINFSFPALAISNQILFFLLLFSFFHISFFSVVDCLTSPPKSTWRGFGVPRNPHHPGSQADDGNGAWLFALLPPFEKTKRVKFFPPCPAPLCNAVQRVFFVQCIKRDLYTGRAKLARWHHRHIQTTSRL